LPTWHPVFRHYVGEYAATNVKFGGKAHETRLDGGDQIIQNAIGNVFMEVPFIAE
jgi:hypothetical protein